MKLVITNHFGMESNNLLRENRTTRYEMLTNGERKKTAIAYPIITTVEIMAWSSRKLLKCSATVMRKNRLQISASFDKKESRRIS